MGPPSLPLVIGRRDVWTAWMMAGVAAVFGAGCGAAVRGGSASVSPRETLSALQRAADRGDSAALYAMLPEQARREESLTAFQARLRGEQVELRELATALRTQEAHHVAPQLQLALRSGASVAVDEDEDGWRVAEPGLGATLAPTPAAAARALRQALLRQSLPALLAILSSSSRGSIRAEMQSIVDALSDPSALESTVTSNTGSRVEFRLTDGRTLRIVREGTNWRIDDVQ